MATPQSTAKAALTSLSQAESTGIAAAVDKGADASGLGYQSKAVEAIVEELAAISAALVTTPSTSTTPQSTTKGALTELRQRESADIAAAEAKGADTSGLGYRAPAVEAIVGQLANIVDAVSLDVEDGADVTDAANVDAAGAVMEADFDANTILAADTDDTPAALTVAEQRLVGRITSGNITALTATQVRTLINVEDGADVTDAANVDAAGAVMEADFNANTILAADTDNNPTARIISTNRVVGRQGAGSLGAVAIGLNTFLGRQGADMLPIPVAVNTIVGRTGTGNLDAIAVGAQRVVCNQGIGLTALEVSSGNVLGKGVTGVLKSLDAVEILDILKGTLTTPFISNQWYNQSPDIDPELLIAGNVLTTNTIVYYVLRIDQTVSLDAVGVHVATVEAGKNARVAIYNSDGTPQPTTLVVESDPLSLAVAGEVTDAVTETQLLPGRYWWAINADSTTAALRRFFTPRQFLGVLGANSVGSTRSAVYTEAHAFGAFPATATPVGPAVRGYVPVIRFQVV